MNSALATSSLIYVFELAERCFAVDAQSVIETVKWKSFKRIPQTPSILIGVQNYRTSVLPLLNLKSLLIPGSNQDFSGDAFVIIQMEKYKFGFGIDTPQGVIKVQSEDCLDHPFNEQNPVYDASIIKDSTVIINRLNLPALEKRIQSILKF